MDGEYYEKRVDFWQNVKQMMDASPLDFLNIFIGNPLPLVLRPASITTRSFWFPYYSANPTLQRVQYTGQAVATRTELLGNITNLSPASASNVAKVLMKYVNAMLENQLPQNPIGLADFEYFLYHHGFALNQGIRISHEDYHEKVSNNCLHPVNDKKFGFIKSYSDLNWFRFVAETETKANLVILDPPICKVIPNLVLPILVSIPCNK